MKRILPEAQELLIEHSDKDSFLNKPLSPALNKSAHEMQYQNFDEAEEATKIYQLVSLQTSAFKRYIVVPILALCTGLFFLLFLYWYPKLRKAFLYSETTFKRATHLFVLGACKFLARRFSYKRAEAGMSLIKI